MFSIPNLFTAFNLTSGILGVFVLMLGRIDLVPFFVCLCLVFDFLDGMLARLLKQKSELGKQLDSLADMVSFGVLPGLLMMVILILDTERFLLNPYYEEIQYEVTLWFHEVLSGETNYYLPFIGLVIPFFSLFRLAKFNLDTRQSNSFIGLPVPANTLFYLAFPLVLCYDTESVLRNWEAIGIVFDPNFLTGVILLFSVLLVSEIPLFSLKFSSLSWNGNQVRFVFLLISLGFIFIFKYWSVSLIVLLYLILSMINNKLFNKAKNEV